MQSHAQRLRQQRVLRPRQAKNDINTGALATPSPDKSSGAVPEPAPPAGSEADTVRRCTKRDLI